MHYHEIDRDLRDTALRLSEMSRRVDFNPRHKVHLRDELIRRHHQLTAASPRRAGSKLWPRVTGLKRLSLAAPPAIAVAIAASIFVWIMPIIGNQKPQEAVAAPIIRALVRSAPTVTGVQWTLRESRGGKPSVERLEYQLKPYQRLYVRDGRSYLFSAGKWLLVVPGQHGFPTTFDWEWAFASLPAQLAAHHVVQLPAARVDGQMTVGLRYGVDGVGGVEATATAWVNRGSGLVVRLEQVVRRHNRVIERDAADYHYQRTG